jgi:hypothetical protein
MPEPPYSVLQHDARISDLRPDGRVSVKCRRCSWTVEMTGEQLLERLSGHERVRQVGDRFRCKRCGNRGAVLDARRALVRPGKRSLW